MTETRRIVRLVLTLITLLALSQGVAGAAHAQAPATYAQQGRGKFQQKKYDEAINLFRLHLRRVPKDYNVWNELGAAYYHSGQPRKAIRYLKHVERKTTEKSYNYYYQGISYVAADVPEKAKEYLNYGAQRFVDEYASRSTFEMAAIEYNDKNRPRAQYWLTLYMQRYPTGVYAPQAARMLGSLRQGVWLEKVEGTQKGDQEEALFKYNKLSLSPKPHYWFMQGGWRTSEFAGQEPAPGGGLKARAYQDMAALVNTGVGYGPWRQDDMTAFGGYTYRQEWITDLDRITEWTDEPTDIEYFPLRGDLLERHHQFYGDFRRDIAGLFYYGIFGRYEFTRIGSTFFPSPDNEELKKVLKVSDTQLIIPWLGAAYNDGMRTLVYLYMRKELNDDSPDHSNKTYEFGLSGGSPVMSLGISHDMDFPENNLTVGIEAFRYEFIYNDYWLDYKREGFFLSAENEFIPRWFVNGLFGYYQDEYVLPRLKLKSCGSQPPNANANEGVDDAATNPVSCTRDDTGTLLQLGVYWNWTQFQRFNFMLQQVDNKNPQQKEFQESKQTIQVMYTMAFPSVKRVARFVDRYADTAFTKEAE